jgi:hypothetical protein
MDRVLKYNLNIDRNEKPSPFEVPEDDEKKEEIVELDPPKVESQPEPEVKVESQPEEKADL